MRENCTGRGSQYIKIFYTVNTNYEFAPEQYITSETFDDQIASAVMKAADVQIQDWEISDSDTNDTQLLTNTTYCIVVYASLDLIGTCDYDSGVSYGPPEKCYPPEIDDVDFDEGMITDIDTYSALSECPSIVDTLEVIIGDVDIDYSEIDVES